ncbi:hypothetical protein [Lactobacillus sp. PSON]|uniref:hypothetical protein n=1 Tax=Lactobacillus sp. PSON TaxID=3455454 RepID=UPI0040439173
MKALVITKDRQALSGLSVEEINSIPYKNVEFIAFKDAKKMLVIWNKIVYSVDEKTKVLINRIWDDAEKEVTK